MVKPNPSPRAGYFPEKKPWHFRGLFGENLKLPFRGVFLVGGFNPSKKYESKWESSPGRGENKKCLKPPPSFLSCFQDTLLCWNSARML